MYNFLQRLRKRNYAKYCASAACSSVSATFSTFFLRNNGLLLIMTGLPVFLLGGCRDRRMEILIFSACASCCASNLSPRTRSRRSRSLAFSARSTYSSGICSIVVSNSSNLASKSVNIVKVEGLDSASKPHVSYVFCTLVFNPSNIFFCSSSPTLLLARRRNASAFSSSAAI